MTDQPFIPILDRGKALAQVQLYASQLSLLVDLVNYGSALLPRVYCSGDKSITDAMLIFHLGREVLMQIDSLQVLMANGCLPGSPSICRSLVEKAHLLFWALKDDTDVKMKYLFVGSIRSARRGALTVLGGNEENAALSEATKIALVDSGLLENAKLELATLNETLNLEWLKSVNGDFEKMRTKFRYECPWSKVYCGFRLRGKNKGTARGIAEEIGRMDEYQVYYADYSSSTHGQDVLSSVSLRSENMDVKSIRNCSSFEGVFHLAANYAIDTYKALLEKYRPGEVENFCDKYVRDWMPRLSD